MKVIPVSNWILDKVYFEVKLVNEFDSLYREWFMEESGVIYGSVDGFLFNLHENPTIEVYQFPNVASNPDAPHDYFERDDDNHVIPSKLFELVQSLTESNNVN